MNALDCVGSSNAINHLASTYHLENLKHFLWKYGGGMDGVHVNNFTISKQDIAKVYAHRPIRGFSVSWSCATVESLA